LLTTAAPHRRKSANPHVADAATATGVTDLPRNGGGGDPLLDIFVDKP